MRSRPAPEPLALECLQGVDEGVGGGLPPLPEADQDVFLGSIGMADALEGKPGLPFLMSSVLNRIFTLFSKWIHLVEADPHRRRNLRSICGASPVPDDVSLHAVGSSP